MKANKIRYWIDYVRTSDDTMHVGGWACTTDGKQISHISVIDGNGNKFQGHGDVGDVGFAIFGNPIA